MIIPAFVRRAWAGWKARLAERAERRARAAAARAVAAEIVRVKAQIQRATAKHRPVRQLQSRLYALMSERLRLELSL